MACARLYMYACLYCTIRLLLYVCYLYVEARLLAWVVAVFGVVPCATSPVAHSHKRGLGLTELVREDVHTVVSNTC